MSIILSPMCYPNKNVSLLLVSPTNAQSSGSQKTVYGLQCHSSSVTCLSFFLSLSYKHTAVFSRDHMCGVTADTMSHLFSRIFSLWGTRKHLSPSSNSPSDKPNSVPPKFPWRIHEFIRLIYKSMVMGCSQEWVTSK